MPAMRPAGRNKCVVVVCADDEADQIRRQLSEFNTGCLITYRRVEDLALNAPAGKVALVVLACNESPAVMRQTLKWLRHRWPGCPITVVGDIGGDEYEVTAREGSAVYVTRPVESEQLGAIVSHVLGGPRKAASAGRTDRAGIDKLIS